MNWYAEKLKIFFIEAIPKVSRNCKGFFLYEMRNSKILENIGLIINAYKPAPNKAAVTAATPPIICIQRLLYAMNLNSFSLYNKALGTMFRVAKKRFTVNN